MTIATIIGLLVFSCLVSGEMKHPVVKRFFGWGKCDSSRPQPPQGMTWANDWDKVMDFSCPEDGAVNSLVSKFRGCKGDRIWSFSCRDVAGDKTCSAWTDYINEWDGPLFHMCDNNGYISGLKSVHDNGKEDRRYKIKCCTSEKFKTVDCETKTFNNFQQDMDYQLPKKQVIAGLYSVHQNNKEDRLWKAYICNLGKRR